MAIGDLVLDTASPDALALVKATAAGWDGALDARALIRGTPFKARDGRSYKGLAALLEQYPNVFTYGTEFGVESVAVPFSHLFLLPRNGALPRERTRADIVRRMEDMWKRAIDPLLGARVDFLIPPDSAGSDAGRAPPLLDVFFGSGVFVPQNAAHPAGRVEVEYYDSARRGEPFPSRVPELAYTEPARPAAFYTGQSALAFAVLSRLTDSFSLPAPAVARIPQLAAPVVLLLGPGRSQLPPSRPLQLTCLEGTGYAARPNMPETDGDEVADEFQVTYEQSTKLLVRYRADVRSSRLCRRHRPGRLAITGIIEPRGGHLPLPDHWWVDLDREDVMLGSALVPKQRSIAVRSGSVHCYDWETFADDRDTAARFKLETATAGGSSAEQGLRILRFQADRRAFGYLERPPAPRPISFDPKAAPDDHYVLDWIDLAAAAEIDLRRRGLGALAAQSPSNGQDITLGARGSTWAVRSPEGVLYRKNPEGAFERRKEVLWEPWAQIALEPFCLTMLPEEEGAA